MNVEVERVARDLAAAEAAGDRFEALAARVRVAALLVAQRPTRRQGHVAGQLRVAPDDFTHGRPQEQVEVDLAGRGGHLPPIELRLAEVPPLAGRVVPKEPGGPSVAQQNAERDR